MSIVHFFDDCKIAALNMETNIDKECSAMGAMFQQIITDMKVHSFFYSSAIFERSMKCATSSCKRRTNGGAVTRRKWTRRLTANFRLTDVNHRLEAKWEGVLHFITLYFQLGPTLYEQKKKGNKSFFTVN